MGSPIKGETARAAPTPPPAPSSSSLKDSTSVSRPAPIQYVPPHSQSAIQQMAHAVSRHSFTGGAKTVRKPPPPPPRAAFTGRAGTVFGQSIGAQGFQNRTFSAGQHKLLQRVINAAQQQPMVRTINTGLARELQQQDSGFQRYAQQLWQRAHGFYPKGAKMPALDFPRAGLETSGPNVGMLTYPRSENPNAAAWVVRAPGTRSGESSVHLTQGAIRQAFMPGTFPGAADIRAYAREVPLHEWAHVFQSGPAQVNRTSTEGGAEAFKQAVAQRLGMRNDRGTQVYGPEVRAVSKRGPRWYMSGQFAPPGYGESDYAKAATP